MTKNKLELVTFYCIEEYNDWEDETWHHYFLNEPGVLIVLEYLMLEENENDFVSLETVTMTWDGATRLTNVDHGGYMQEHWFARLTDLDGLRQATSDDLYKGGIRKYGEELFVLGEG